jgi:signal transduction histidine kinase
LFDTPPNRQEIRLGLAIVGVLFAAFLIILPLRDVRLAVVDAFVPMIDATMALGELIIGALLYAQAAVFRSRALIVLASGYLFAALLIGVHALTFPGAFSATGLLGARINTTAWIATFWRLELPITFILYAMFKRADSAAHPEAEWPHARVLWGVLGAIALAALATLLATAGHDLLPPLFLNNRDSIRFNVAMTNVITIALTIIAMVVMFRQKKSVLDVWLLVALSGWLIQSVLNMPLHARFTFGGYGLFGLILVSNLIIMLALVTESSRLYARLALSVAAGDRERENRLMSMDAMAAAIAHEVGQPLTAVTLNAKAGIGWLTREPPDSERAISSFRAAMDAGRRTFEVIKSVRATFAKESGEVGEFSVNDLVRETALLLDRELAGQRVSIQLELDESLPLIRANRAQIQRVIINLLTNAIDALAATRRRTRRIWISSVLCDDQGVLLEVSDSGVGMAPEQMVQVFDPFFTTKSNGTGLGLSLSRTIVEDHGGRLWASSSGGSGATLHLQLPSGLVH